VNVSLLDIDNEHKKLSLSIRAANAPAAPSEDTPDLVVVSVSEGEPEATALDEAALDVLTEVVAAAVVKVDLQDEKESGESTESAPVE
jgi:ribosomal protein S1